MAPIQSMDDEHTETFKLVMLKELLDRDFQVILLTHMDTLGRFPVSKLEQRLTSMRMVRG
jgi:hypothetical protein